jgi:hypothetical protein
MNTVLVNQLPRERCVLIRDALDPDPVLCAKIRVVNNAAEHESINLFIKGGERLDLGIILRTRDHGEEGPIGSHNPLEVRDLLLQEETRIGRQVPGDVICGGMGLPGTERVIYVNIGQPGKLERETLPGLSLGLLPEEPPRVGKIDTAQLSLFQLPDGKVDGRIDPHNAMHRVRGKFRDVQFCMELLFKISYDRLDGLLGPAGYRSRLFIFRPPYMGHHDRPAAALDNVKKGPDGTVDPIGIAYLSPLDYIMIEPDEDDLPVEFSILDQRQFSL